MAAHVALATVLYAALTIVRAPSAWGVGARPDGSNPWAEIEPRISANLKNQFEWPVLFYVACLLAIYSNRGGGQSEIWLAWLFVAGRLIHSGVQIFTSNIRLRGVVFTINFLAVLGLWAAQLIPSVTHQ